MEKKRIRWFLPSKYHQEEDWLNRMAEHGWQLIKVSGLIYTFTDTEPAYTYRLDFKAKLSKDKRQDYYSFLADTGIEKIGQRGKWTYFRKLKSEGAFDLYSDQKSKLQFLLRISNHLSNLFIIPLYLFTVFISEIISGITDRPALIGAITGCIIFFVFDFYLIIQIIELKSQRDQIKQKGQE